MGIMGEGCLGRVRGELEESYPLFGVRETNGRLIDVADSFAPKDTWIIITKLIVFLWAVSSLVISVGSAENPEFFMAYLTHWTLVISLAYLLLSLLYSTPCSPRPAQPRGGESDDGSPNLVICLEWALFAVATMGGLLVTIVFWAIEYNISNVQTEDDGENGTYHLDPFLLYRTIMVHGVVAVMILVDGFYMNNIPIRAKHFYFFLAYEIIYLIWTVIHAYLGIGNPNNNPDDNIQDNENDLEVTDDDAIYQVLNWNSRPQFTALVAASIIFVLSPVLFGLLWLFSVYATRRRYISMTRAKHGKRLPT